MLYVSKTSVTNSLFSLAFAGSVLLAPEVVAQNEATEEKEQTTTLETVTVVGQKQKKALKDVTASVSVISDETFRSMENQSISETLSAIPNVVTLSGAVPDIRGVSGNGAAGGFNSISGGAKARVTTLIDGVAEPFVADLTGDSGLWDVEQVEVYRGPQSTINGRNSIAGSIFIKTKDPTFDWEGAARLGYRNQDQFIDTSAVVSGPLSDQVAFRVSAQHLDGTTLVNNQPYENNPPGYPLDEVTTNRARAKLLWQPSDRLRMMFAYSSNREKGDAGRKYYVGDNPWSYQRIFLRNMDTDAQTFSSTLNYAFTDYVSLDLLIAKMNYQWGFDSYEKNPKRQQQLSFDEDNVNIDARLNFGTIDDLWNGYLGLAYFDREQDIKSLGGFRYNGLDTSDSKAVYGELNYQWLPNARLTVGGRVERESQLRRFNIRAISATLDQSKTIFLPKVAVQYDLSERTILSFGARKGYNAPGGALDFASGEYYFYDSESVNTYEAGIRSSNHDDSLNLSATAFFNSYDGYQALASNRRIVNMNDVETYGAEVELVAKPNQDWTFRTGLGLLSTEIKDAGAVYASATGNELNSAPALTLNVGAKYWLADSLSVGVDANYVGRYYGDINNTKERISGNYSVLNARADYSYEHWDFSMFVKNLANRKDFLVSEPPGRRYPAGFKAILQPRTFGFSVTYNYY